MTSDANNRAQELPPPQVTGNQASEWAAGGSQLQARLTPTHSSRPSSPGVPVYHVQNKDGETSGEVTWAPPCLPGTRLGMGLLSPLGSWR